MSQFCRFKILCALIRYGRYHIFTTPWSRGNWSSPPYELNMVPGRKVAVRESAGVFPENLWARRTDYNLLCCVRGGWQGDWTVLQVRCRSWGLWQTGLYYRWDLGLAIYDRDWTALQVRCRSCGLWQTGLYFRWDLGLGVHDRDWTVLQVRFRSWGLWQRLDCTSGEIYVLRFMTETGLYYRWDVSLAVYDRLGCTSGEI